MSFDFSKHDALSGSILIAHPSMQDRNFSKSVVLLSAHDPEDGSLGIIINRPIGKSLGDIDSEFASGALANVPIYEGGPVQTDQMLLAAWHWIPEQSAFRFYFGITTEKAEHLLESVKGIELRAFLGYAGWTKGQLEAEREQKAWLISAVNGHMMEGLEGAAMWREIIATVCPELTLLADAPEDPEVN